MFTALEEHNIISDEPQTNLEKKSADVPVAIDGECEKKPTCSSKMVKLKIKQYNHV